MKREYAWGLVLILLLAIFAAVGSAAQGPPDDSPTVVNLLLSDEVDVPAVNLGAPIAAAVHGTEVVLAESFEMTDNSDKAPPRQIRSRSADVMSTSRMNVLRHDPGNAVCAL